MTAIVTAISYFSPLVVGLREFIVYGPACRRLQQNWPTQQYNRGGIVSCLCHLAISFTGVEI